MRRAQLWGSSSSAFVRGTLARPSYSLASCSSSQLSSGLYTKYAIASFHSSGCQYARVAVAEAAQDVTDVPVQEKRNVNDMTPEEFEAYERENKQKEAEVKKALQEMDPIDYALRLQHLFTLQKKPRLVHYHILLRKVKKPKHLKQAIRLLKYYQAVLTETSTETAKLLLEAGVRSKQVKRVIGLFGSTVQYRLWPTTELMDIALDYYLEKENLGGALFVLQALGNRKDLDHPKEMFEKVYNQAFKNLKFGKALKVAKCAKQYDVPWNVEWYDQLVKVLWGKKRPKEVLYVHKQREADGVSLNSNAARYAALAYLSAGQAEEAAKLAASLYTAANGQKVNFLHGFVGSCVNDPEKLRKPFEEFAQLFPTYHSDPAITTETVLEAWEKDVKNREKYPKSEKKESKWIAKKMEERKQKLELYKQLKANKEKNDKRKAETRRKIRLNTRRKKRALNKAVKILQQDEERPDSRVAARRPIKIDPFILKKQREEARAAAAAAGNAAAAPAKKAPPKKKD